MANIIKSYFDIVRTVQENGIHQSLTDGLLISLSREIIIAHEYPNMIMFAADYFNPIVDLAFGRLDPLPEIPRLTAQERVKIYEKEKYERDMIISDLKFASHIMMSKYEEPITSRRFVATNDSCMSFCQVTLNEDCFRWVFVSRSTEVNKMLPSDLLTIGVIIEEWTSWFRGYVQHESRQLYDKKVSLVLLLNNPHYYSK